MVPSSTCSTKQWTGQLAQGPGPNWLRQLRTMPYGCLLPLASSLLHSNWHRASQRRFSQDCRSAFFLSSLVILTLLIYLCLCFLIVVPHSVLLPSYSLLYKLLLDILLFRAKRHQNLRHVNAFKSNQRYNWHMYCNWCYMLEITDIRPKHYQQHTSSTLPGVSV